MVESSVTEKEPTMSGRAPNLSSVGIQFWPERKAPMLMPSPMNVVRPCWATMTMSVSTTMATSATQAPVSPRPTFSRRRLGSNCFAID